MRTKEPVIRYEDAAERRENIAGWVCRKCSRYWGEDEHMARWCCSDDHPCKCGNRKSKHYTVCDSCREKKAHDSWFAMPEHEWDGEFPIGTWDDDKFFWDEESVAEYLCEACEVSDPEELTDDQIETVKFCLCEQHKHEFELAGSISDYLPEDDDTDFREIDKIINDWIAANVPKVWFCKKKRIGLKWIKGLGVGK
jgi:hypothetical protein